jgi:TatD DNase family protein
MLTDSHSHKVNGGQANTLYNVRINDEPLSLPHGPRLFFSVGIHPWDADRFHPGWLDTLNMLLNYQQVVAIGECGMDKNTDIPLNVQQEVLERQLIVSEICRKPLILHCVGCFNELIALREKHSPTQHWIIHGFRGKPELATQLLRAGFHLSFGEKFNAESVLATPLERLLVETDDSELDIEDVVLRINALKQVSLEDYTAATSVFNL